jgi:hypothetical protein
MVDQGYMLNKPPGPPAWKRTLDQVVVPAAIDAAAVLEAGIERVAVWARGRPVLACVTVLGLGWAAARSRPRPRRR